MSTLSHIPRVAVCHPGLGMGGSEVTAMHVVQALAPDHEVHLLTTGEVDLASLNAWCATDVQPDQVRVRTTTLPWQLRRMTGGDALRGAYHTRHCRKLSGEFDVLISAYNFCDFGKPGIQLIADFSWHEEIRAELDRAPSTGIRSAFHRGGLLQRLYRAHVRRVAPASGRDLFAGEDLILSNSSWSVDLIQARHGVQTDVLYPPVPFEASSRPWGERASRFVTIGRVSPEKQIERMAEIVGALRARGHKLELHVAGDADGDEYARSLKSRLAREAPWVVFVGAMVGEAKREFLAGSRFGLHARSGEPFGIAVAEMVRAGCVVFTPAEGGQAEIVSHPDLRYRDLAEAVEKIARVLESGALLEEVRGSLSASQGRFSNEAFAQQIRAAVKQFRAS
ncbi:MAG: glycosyltransferase family 4 protein [Planctomycetota bacterium]|nr:glycosyltransferase family 4 protein [Planctomycetota bacterium]